MTAEEASSSSMEHWLKSTTAIFSSKRVKLDSGIVVREKRHLTLESSSIGHSLKSQRDIEISFSSTIKLMRAQYNIKKIITRSLLRVCATTVSGVLFELIISPNVGLWTLQVRIYKFKDSKMPWFYVAILLKFLLARLV